MRFKQIIENTTAGSVASVAKPMMTQTRENTNVRGLKPVQQVMKGAAKKKGPYSNSIVENKVNEDDLAEQDLIVIPGQGRLKGTGFVKHDMDQGEHEGHTLKNSLHTIARAASDLDERLSVQSEFPEWVSEKIGAAKGMMVSVMDYLISSQEMQHDMEEGRVAQLPTRGADYSKYDTDHLKMLLRPGILHRDEARFKALIRKELQKREQQGVAEGSEDTVSFREMVDVVDKHYPKYYAELSGSNISDKQFEQKITSAYKKIMQKQSMAEGSEKQLLKQVKQYCRDAWMSNGKLWVDCDPLQAKKISQMLNVKPISGSVSGEYAFDIKQGVAEGKDDKIAQLKQDYATAVHWSKNEKSPQKREAARQKAEKIKAHLEKQYKQGVAEGAKVDRMVKHVAQSEKKLGHSKKEAENIAWATANKRGMLDNKNKKK